MDYVKETLQRQSGLWLALFGGSEDIETTESRQEQVLREKRQAEQTVFPAYNSREQVGETGMANRAAEHDGTRAEEELLVRGRETLLREQAFQRPAEEESGVSRTERRVQRAEAVSAETARWEAEAALREGRHDLETADARAISRRFERDARRYDGGFVFY